MSKFVETLERRAVDWGLPTNLNLDVFNTGFHTYFEDRPNHYFIDKGSIDEHAKLLYERDLQEAYRIRFKQNTGADFTRVFDAEDKKFRVLDYCRTHYLPICIAAGKGSPFMNAGIVQALEFDLRLVTKYADDDAARFKNRRRPISIVKRLIATAVGCIGVYLAAFFGISHALDSGLDKAKHELDSYAFPRMQEELREGIDDNIERYLGPKFVQNDDDSVDCDKSRKNND